MSEEEVIEKIKHIDRYKDSGDTYTREDVEAIGRILSMYEYIIKEKRKFNQIYGRMVKQQKEIEELKHFKKEVINIIKYADDTAEPTYWNIRKLLGLGEINK